MYISADDRPDTSDHRPDIGIRPREPSPPSRRRHKREPVKTKFDWINTVVAIEFKHSSTEDPFDDDFANTGFWEKTSDKSRSARGQLAKYAAEQFVHQHRRFILQIIIFGNRARFIFWDQSGAVVSASFDYVEDPTLLGTFLWEVSRMTAEQQGWDPTVVRASEKEEEAFYAAIKKAWEEGKLNNRPDGPGEVYATLRSYYPVYKVLVKDGVGSRAFTLSGHFYVDRGPFGRCTRGYLAHDLQEDNVKLLKDGWAVSHPGCMPEPTTFAKLGAHAIPSILAMTCGGTVDSDGLPQRTRAQEFALERHEWRAPCVAILRSFEHVRLVQPLAFTPDSLRSSEEFVEVARDIAICEHSLSPQTTCRDSSPFTSGIGKAHDVARILHRDISFGNILFVRSDEGVVQGILNDWDHATSVSGTQGEPLPFRSVSRVYCCPGPIFIDACTSLARTGNMAIHAYSSSTEP